MKTRLIFLVLIAALAVTPAMADTWSGTVTASATTEAEIPSAGTLTSITVEVGETVKKGQTIGAIKETKVFAPADGTVAAVHLEVGDKASGTVLEISPISRYTLTCTAANYAKTPANALIHSGEQLYVKCTADGTHHATARVTTIDGSAFNAEVTGGELYVGETVFLYRDSRFNTNSLVGKGTVTAHDTIPVSGSGVILLLRVGVSDTVERGQWLFSTASDENTEIIIPADGIVTSVNVKAGDAVQQDQSAVTIATAVTLRAEVSADDAIRFKKGGVWYYTRNDDPHETHRTCTVQHVLTNETDASATIVLVPEEKELPIGLGIILTDEKD